MKILTIILALIISSVGPPFIGGIEVSASVVLKIQVANPSKTEGQSVPVKVYLPKEVSPKDIIDLGNLTLSYDADTGMYFVHAEVPLGPGESVDKFVEMKDVWQHTEEELTALENDAMEAAKELEGTPYEEEGAALVREVQQKIEEILKRQEETANNPEEKIRAYRQGTGVVSSVDQTISQLDQLKLEASVGETLEGPSIEKKEGEDDSAGKGEGKEKDQSVEESEGAGSRIPVGSDPDGAPLGRSISMTTAWRIIFGILIFLGVLSGVFFMFWHRILGVSMEYEQQGEPLPTEFRQEEGSKNALGGPQGG